MTLTITRNLLEHSFYTRWLAGTLTDDELRDYAAQYAHVVRGLPAWLRSAGQAAHAEEEQTHIELWDAFSSALGAGSSEPNPATRALLERASRLSSGPAGVAVAWAIESQSAPVSREKLAGLQAHYDVGAAGEAYFQVHAERDLEHTAELDAVIAELDESETVQAQAIAATVQDGLWDLLTSVEKAA